MNVVIYAACSFTSLLCAWLLLRAYFSSRYKLLFWSGLCFIGLTLNNVLLMLDKVVFPDTHNLLTLRLVVALSALLPLLYGLIFEE